MPKLYHIKCQPTDGPTLESDTCREWMYGADFTVVETDYMPFQHTWREQKRGFKFHITRQDVVDAEARYGVRFDITFIFRTVKEHFEALAEDSYGAAQSLDLLTKGQ